MSFFLKVPKLFISFPWDNTLVRMTEHKLALGEEVVEEYTLGEGEGHSMVVDRSSYSSEHKLVGTVGEGLLGGRGSRVFREVPLVP